MKRSDVLAKRMPESMGSVDTTTEVDIRFVINDYFFKNLQKRPC